MILQDLLADAVPRLRRAGVASPERDARRLLAHAAGIAPDRIGLAMRDAAPQDLAARLEPLLAARAAHQPVAQIVGARCFWGRMFRVTPAVLDPRPETETLIALALDGPRPSRLLDLGTGSGCLALTLLAECPAARAVATDISRAALGVARASAADLGLSDRVAFQHADWWQGVTGRFDLIVSNPPYIAADEMPELSPDVRLWEDPRALTPGGDGLSAYRALAAGLSAHLLPGGRAFFEIGARQGPAVMALFAAAGFDAACHPDLDGRDRVVSARWAA
ncbi:MAG: peptide chain release factor N(5)-glutamine methyltransferase [Pseudomonadota bacterium]